MDLDNGGKYDNIHTFSLAMLNNTYNCQKRDGEHKVDIACSIITYRCGDNLLHCVYKCLQNVWRIKTA